MIVRRQHFADTFVLGIAVIAPVEGALAWVVLRSPMWLPVGMFVTRVGSNTSDFVAIGLLRPRWWTVRRNAH